MKNKSFNRDIIHNKICSKADYLHKVFAKLCPSNTKFIDRDYGGRLKAFSKLVSNSETNFEKNIILEDFKDVSNLKSRSGRKKFMDSLIELCLISKDTKKRVYYSTLEAENIWKGLSYMIDDEKKGKKEKNVSYWKYYCIKIKTNGEDYCEVLESKCFKNICSGDIKYFEFYVGGDTPLYNFKVQDCSDNIESYEIFEDNTTFKSFRLNLKKALNQGDEITIWYRYNWPGLLLNSCKNWDYSVNLKSPIKFFSFEITLPKSHKIDANSFSLDNQGIKKYSKNIGEFNDFGPIFLENIEDNEIIWKMENIPSNFTTRLLWTHS
jgi:hypothetical protein